MRKKYNTPHRRHVVKTRMTDEEYADFTGRLAAYEISQSELSGKPYGKRPYAPLSPFPRSMTGCLPPSPSSRQSTGKSAAT